MNLILFEREEIGRPLPRSDPRALHLLNVLKRVEGGAFDAGIPNGPRGKGLLVGIGTQSLDLSFEWGADPAPLDPISLVIGLPRPQTARKILQEAAALGVSRMHFVKTEKGEAGYAESVLWRDGEWRRHLRAGAEQAFATQMPEVTHGLSVAEAVERERSACAVALDNYEARGPLSLEILSAPLTLLIGPERGWSAAERTLFRGRGIVLAHLGDRVLRSETACVAAVSVAKARLGLY